ncbi:MAG: RDD family protein [Pseudanabaenaceae cyanobacterium bins.68]|nr:RDD family protein [Pseudanabaenaceae cyanobacterium bins.68]
MIDFEPAYTRLPLASLSARIGGFVIDFFACYLLALLLKELLGWGIGAQFLFVPVWLSDRVLFNGQSLGRWAMSLRVVNLNYGKPTGALLLLRRESLILVFLLLLLNSLDQNGMITSLTLFAPLPLVADLVFAAADTLKRQSVHDRLGESIVIFTRKGWQLDLKLTKWLGLAIASLGKLAQRSQQFARESRRRAKPSQSAFFDSYNNFPEPFDDQPRRPVRRRSRRPRD